MPDQPTTCIDLTPIITEAGGRGQRGDDLDRATGLLRDWHGADANKYGTIPEREAVSLAKVGKCHATALLAPTGRGHWLAGHDYEAQGYAGSGSAPSIWSARAFATRDDAIRHEADRAADWFDGVARSGGSCVSEALKRDAEKMIVALELIVSPKAAPAMQLSRF